MSIEQAIYDNTKAVLELTAAIRSLRDSTYNQPHDQETAPTMPLAIVKIGQSPLGQDTDTGIYAKNTASQPDDNSVGERNETVTTVTITREVLQDTLARAIKAVGGPTVRAIFGKYKIARISDAKEEQFAALHKDLLELTGDAA